MRYFNQISFLLLLLLGLNACVDQNFDAPPAEGDLPDIQANTTIAELKQLHIPGEFFEITEDVILEAVVVGDDESGNIFKTLVIQDETAGINLHLDAIDLYNDYPVGRTVYVKAQGMWMSDFNGLIQLGGGIFDNNGDQELSRLAEVLIPRHLVKGPRGDAPDPIELTIDQFDESYVSMLVTLSDVQFATADAGETYADAINRFSLNRGFEDCNGNESIIRSSGFSDFANEVTPQGKGSLTGVLSIFGSDYQMIIRDLDDVDMTGERCGDNPDPDPDLQANSTLADVKALYSPGQFVEITDELILKTTVVGDDESGNIFKTLVLQDETAGIHVIIDEFDLYQDFPVGQTVFVKAQGLWIGDFNGLIQLGGGTSLNNGQEQMDRIEESDVNKFLVRGSKGDVPAPLTLAIDDFDESYLSRLVQLTDVQFADADANQTYADADNLFSLNRTLEDCDGNETIVRTSGYADFASQLTPDGNGILTGILSIYQGTYQLTVRDLGDVSMSAQRCDGSGGGGGGGGGGTGNPLDNLSEDFQSGSSDTDINLSGWTNSAVKGARLWRFKEFDGNVYAQATAFQDTEPEMEAWLITPAINLDNASELSFESAQAFHNHDGLTVLISTDYDGQNINSATWTDLNPILASSSDDFHDWIQSGEIDLSDFNGTGYIAFRYEGNPNSGTTSYRIDNVTVE